MRIIRLRLGMVSVLSSFVLFLGCGGGKTSHVTSTTGDGSNDGSSTRITVNGLAQSNDAMPLAGATVAIVGVGSTTADSAGNFTFTDVPVPYDIGVGSPTDKAATFYVGLSTESVVLTVWANATAKRTASVAGDLVGGGSQTTDTCLDVPASQSGSAAATAGSPGGLPGGSSVFSVNTSWYGPTTVAATVYGIQKTSDAVTRLPTSYNAYGQMDVRLNDGDALTGQTLALSSVGTGDLSGTVAVADGNTLDQISVKLGCQSLVSDDAPTSAFGYAVPQVSTLLRLNASAVGPGGEVETNLSVDAAAATGLTITLPEAPAVLTPADVVGLVDATTEFSWTAPAGTVSELIVGTESSHTFFMVVTAGTSATLPDFASVGLPIPESADCTWIVMTVTPGDIALGATKARRFATSPATAPQPITIKTLPPAYSCTNYCEDSQTCGGSSGDCAALCAAMDSTLAANGCGTEFDAMLGCLGANGGACVGGASCLTEITSYTGCVATFCTANPSASVCQ